jgi:hypothetical protein
MRTALAAALLASCAVPDGPGAYDTIALGVDADLSAYDKLRVVSYPDDEPFEYVIPYGQERRWAGYDLKQETFPVEYQAVQYTGWTHNKRWRVTAWLAKDSDYETEGPAIHLAPGTPYGTRDFTVDRCGRNKYCHHNRIDFAIDSVVPEDAAP